MFGMLAWFDAILVDLLECDIVLGLLGSVFVWIIK